MATELTLSKTIDIQAAVSAPNVCTMLAPADVEAIGRLCKRELDEDLTSRKDWEERHVKIMEVALQVVKPKSFPWPNAANVKFPVLAIAAMQYAARAYAGLIPPDGVVKYQVFGDDPKGEKDAQATKLARHMNYQLMEEDNGKWETETDRALLIQPIVGCAFKKIYYDQVRRQNRSVLVFPRDLVISYFTRDLESAPRLSHLIPFYPNDIKERVVKGFFLDVPEIRQSSSLPTDALTNLKDRSQGLSPPAPSDSLKWETYVEQSRVLDLDGDGYGEPYAVTFHAQTGKVVRIIARFSTKGIERIAGGKGRIAYIAPINYFEKYPFVPSPDGGIYDLGFGNLLYPITETINTAVNQLLDAGTMKTMGGGFMGRGAKIKSGNAMFQPGEWKQVDTTGDDIRKSILQLPVGEPSAVLFNLLNLLVQYAERLSSSVDQMVGQTPDQNTPAETSRNALEQGMKVFSSIFKRTWRSMKGEFAKLYKLNQLYLPDQPQPPFMVSCRDYDADPVGIRPCADPNSTSEAQAVQHATMLYNMSGTDPGVVRWEAGRRLLEAMKIPNIESVYPDPKGPNKLPPPPPSADLLVAQSKLKAVEVREMDTQAKHKLGAAKLMILAQESAAKVQKLQQEAIAIQHELLQPRDPSAFIDAMEAHKQAGHQRRLDILDRDIEVSKAKHNALLDAISTLNSVVDSERQHDLARQQQQPAAIAGPGPASGADAGGTGGEGATPPGSALAAA